MDRVRKKSESFRKRSIFQREIQRIVPDDSMFEEEQKKRNNKK